MRLLAIDVHGIPAPQGSKRVYNGRLVESSKKVKPWRQDVKQAILDSYDGDTARGPVVVQAIFYLPRPKSHYRTGRHAGELKDNAPIVCATKPDLDKLQRSTGDAITESGIIIDDSQIVGWTVHKLYADPAPVGAHITIDATEAP